MHARRLEFLKRMFRMSYYSVVMTTTINTTTSPVRPSVTWFCWLPATGVSWWSMPSKEGSPAALALPRPFYLSDFAL